VGLLKEIGAFWVCSLVFLAVWFISVAGVPLDE